MKIYLVAIEETSKYLAPKYQNFHGQNVFAFTLERSDIKKQTFYGGKKVNYYS